MNFVTELRNEEMFQKFIDEAKEFIPEEYEFDKKRRIVKRLLPGET